MAIPTVPEAHLIAVEPDLALGLLDDLLDRVARARHPRQLLERNRLRRQREVIRQLGGITALTDERATTPAGPGNPSRLSITRTRAQS